MEYEFIFNKKELTDMSKKMALPLGFTSKNLNSKKGFVSPVIFPQVTPIWEGNNYIKSKIDWFTASGINTWIEFDYKYPLEITSPIRIPIDVENLIKVLGDFEDTDEITFSYDDENKIQMVANDQTTIHMPVIGEEPDFSKIFDSYPGHLDQDGMILFNEGTLRPDIFGTIDVEFFKRSINSIKKYSSQKENDLIYFFQVHGDKHCIEAHSDFEDIGLGNNIFSKIYYNDSIVGSGKLYYIYLLPAVINVLFGEIKFATVDQGPLWITQDLPSMKIRYLIPRAHKSKI